MNLELVVPLSLAMSLVSFSLIAKWYVMPWLVSVPRKKALTPLLLLHSFRHIGLAFLVPGVTAFALDPRFANPAAYGDLITSVLALAALMALHFAWPLQTPLVWLFNTVGTLDLLYAVYQGLQRVPAGHLGATHFIPAIIVPALLVTHYMIFALLVRKPS